MPAEWPALAASSNRKPLEFGVPARLGRAAGRGGAAMGFAVVGDPPQSAAASARRRLGLQLRVPQRARGCGRLPLEPRRSFNF